jgi:hypothetical protein
LIGKHITLGRKNMLSSFEAMKEGYPQRFESRQRKHDFSNNREVMK